jgi:UDP-N-acetylmuramoylalanine--D-glutamate ligase
MPVSLKGKTIAVVGLGKSGVATLDALKTSGAPLIAWDDDVEKRKEVEKKGFVTRDPAQIDWQKVNSLILSPGIPDTLPAPHPAAEFAKKHGVEIVCDVDFFFRLREVGKFIGITGTNGKSTTTALIAHILKSAGKNAVEGGNLGTPVLSFPTLGSDGFYVIEMSSYQCERTPNAAFDAAVWLNITPDHIDRHGTMDGYVTAKRKMLRNTSKKQILAIGVDDEPSRSVAAKMEKQGHWQVVPISAAKALDRGVSVFNNNLFQDGKNIFSTSEAATLPGAHNAQNMAAAFAIAQSFGIAPADIQKAFLSYPGLPHRQKLIHRIGNVRFINDSKATNADAAAKALACYDTIYWIAGGRPKEGGLNGLEKFMPRIAQAFLIGEAAPAFGKWLDGKAPYTQCETLATAVQKAAEMATASGKKDAVVLLSPACASWDQFRNYEHRGDEFIRLVEAYASKAKVA